MLPLPLLLPRGRAIEPPPGHMRIFHPVHRLTLPPNRIRSTTGNPPHPLFRPPPRPPIIALVIDWIIKVLITHPSSSAPRLPSAHPFGLSLVSVPLRARACACVFHAAANYLLRRSMNSNRNYISSDIQLEAEGGGGAIRRRKKVHTGASRLKAGKGVAAREKPCRGSCWSPPPPFPPPARLDSPRRPSRFSSTLVTRAPFPPCSRGEGVDLSKSR